MIARPGLVEMGGVEPPSREIRRKHATCVSRRLMSQLTRWRATWRIGNPVGLESMSTGGLLDCTRYLVTPGSEPDRVRFRQTGYLEVCLT
jgi:hypothetical protein